MEWNEQEKKLIEKAEFYKTNEIKCHVLTVPKGTFKNGLIVSNIEEGKFFWFIDIRTGIPQRLFLSEIWDIEEYKEKGEVI